MTKLSASSTYSNDGPECPYCGHQFWADDPAYYYDDENYMQDCDDCGKIFHVSVYTRTLWTCEAIEPKKP